VFGVVDEFCLILFFYTDHGFVMVFTCDIPGTLTHLYHFTIHAVILSLTLTFCLSLSPLSFLLFLTYFRHLFLLPLFTVSRHSIPTFPPVTCHLSSLSMSSFYLSILFRINWVIYCIRTSNKIKQFCDKNRQLLHLHKLQILLSVVTVSQLWQL